MHSPTNISSEQPAEDNLPRPLAISTLVDLLGEQEHRILYAIRSRRIRPLYRLGVARIFGPDAIPLIREALKETASNRSGGRPPIV